MSRSLTWISGLPAVFGLFATLFAANTAVAEPPLRDPTQPPAAVQVAIVPEAADPTVPLSLQAIIFADGRRVAIINDRRLQERDLVQSAQIIAIERDRVRLKRGPEELELRLIPTDIKKELTTVPAEPDRLVDRADSQKTERGMRP